MKKIKYILIIIVLVCIDQISKFYIIANKQNLPKQIISGAIKFNYCENYGIAFGIGQGSSLVFAIIAIIIITIALIFIFKYFKKINKLILLGTAILLSGGIGNLIDRIRNNYVIDFIDVSELIKFPIFNFADICVVIGVIIIGITYIILINRGEKIEGNNSTK